MSPLSPSRGVHAFMLYLQVAYADSHWSTAMILAEYMPLGFHLPFTLVFSRWCWHTYSRYGLAGMAYHINCWAYSFTILGVAVVAVMYWIMYVRVHQRVYTSVLDNQHPIALRAAAHDLLSTARCLYIEVLHKRGQVGRTKYL